MNKKLFLLLGLLTYLTGTFAQNFDIEGKIVDRTTGNPIEGAHITAKGTEVAVTDGAGFFMLEISGIPALLRITHVTYGIIEYMVESVPDGQLIIRIEQQVTGLEEVQITGDRLRSLTGKQPFSVQDFALDQGTLWLLGFENNQPGKQRLYLASLYGDSLTSIPVRRAESLFVDAFHNVHIVFPDIVFQLYHPDRDRIEFNYPTGKDRFIRLLGDIELSFNKKLIYTQENRASQTRRIYYIQENDPVQYSLAFITDTLEKNRQKTTNKMDYYFSPKVFNIPELENMWTSANRYTKRGSRFDDVINTPVPYEVFESNNELFIINYLKDSLLRYDEAGFYMGAIPIDFHKKNSAAGTDYKDLECITDPISQKVYLLEHKMAQWILSPLDTRTGLTGSPVDMPEFPGMSGIYVYNEAVFFLYPEKQYPYYNRLFRFQLNPVVTSR